MIGRSVKNKKEKTQIEWEFELHFGLKIGWTFNNIILNLDYFTGESFGKILRFL
jgi:hypothetical protein